MDKDTKLRISIGEDDDSVLFHIRQTQAPREYDGFGTIEVTTWSASEGRYDNRLVLIRDEQYQWQSGRYGSGMFACTVPEYFDMRGVTQELWHRIDGGKR